MEKFFVYILYSKLFNRVYIGQTNNLEKRIHLHNSGHVPSTKPYLPWQKIYHEELPSRIEAVLSEKTWKKSHKRRLIKELIKNIEIT
ncbi:MAG: GIY-YIG nuclease family protein [Saprospiraceae bacterium]|nr:GIY-YIG nuclease family protein [Saprospiraceae bacterium]MBK6567092.1 GIY-YIG nuclease family protein [Saprospiraceae bacterium]MBK7524773.1 GIY-YIG nuclease family protein [Saprospiraceae bacterium]MBK8081487.1 GIY-YIG nuclease family protein [Saprospiraceae bacterium]MBK8549451.1 GIY-YIG nuclease family protein [Saprospiraceae bacterium]